MRCRKNWRSIVLFPFMTWCSGWSDAASAMEPPGERSEETLSAEATGKADGVKAAVDVATLKALQRLFEREIDPSEAVEPDAIEAALSSLARSGKIRIDRKGDARVVGDDVEVTVVVTTSRATLRSRLVRQVSSGRFSIDGETLAADLEKARDDRLARKELLERVFSQLPESIIKLQLVDADGRPDGQIDSRLARPIGDGANTQITLFISMTFDEVAWNERVKPTLRSILETVASKSFREGIVLDKQGETSQRTKYGLPPGPVYGVRQEGLRIAEPGNNLVGLQVEEWARDRRLIFDVFEIEAGIDPTFAKPRILKIRLLDADGRTIHGGEFRVAGAIGLGHPEQFGASVDGVSGGTVAPWSYSEKHLEGDSGLALPQAQTIRQVGVRKGQSFTLLGPRIFFKPALDWTLEATRAWVMPIPFTLPTEDVALVDEVSIELEIDRRPQPKSVWDDPGQVTPLE